MIRERKSTGEVVMPLAAFRELPFGQACRLAGVDSRGYPLKRSLDKPKRRRRS